ncbi:MAG TPA: hypothetical protein VNY24_08735 [Candidatus Acidoferrales bacterium]|jgi:hypothetical protein|nr:hypothetical protein [Candidatus Acidoferrales bacterium]
MSPARHLCLCFTFTIGNGEAIMLPHVLSQRIHEKILHVHTRNFRVVKNIPAESAIAPVNPLIVVDRIVDGNS